MTIIRVKDYNEMSRTAANIVSAQVILFSKSLLGLATGETPIGMYKQLIEWNRKGDLDFSQVKTVNLDEYIGLSKDHHQSYFWFMRQNFFSHININAKNVFLPEGLVSDTDSECVRYEDNINKLGGIDLQVLGLGHNGHIGFNEPGTVFKKKTHVASLTERTIAANSRFFNSAEEVPRKAITMGMGTIMQAKRIVLMCSGEEKSEMLYKALCGDIDPMVPASILQLHTQLTVVADDEAIRLIAQDKRISGTIKTATAASAKRGRAI